MMRVHLICNTAEHRVVGRLAVELCARTGWTLSREPDPNAQLNYYFPYIEWRGNPGTKTAAWFTHLEYTVPEKVELWKKVAKGVNLRLTSARMYLPDLDKYGLSILVTPPLDSDKFRPVSIESILKEITVVGVSGYTYAGGRKGEGLVKKLLDSPLSSKIKLVATGRGWPTEKVQSYPWDIMQEFYQGIDIYLLTSLIEGIPMGVLEALACGCKVVIPREVGLLDDIPEAEGILRYEKGDFNSMCRALEEAIVRHKNVSSLRASVARYTFDVWVGDHARTFTDFLIPSAPPQVPRGGEWRKKAGVYYVAYGKQARKCVVHALLSWKKYMPDIPIALASDTKLEVRGVNYTWIQNPDEDVGGRSVKTRIDELAPKEWEYILYLDADTELTGPVDIFFDSLARGWDFVICTNPAQYHLAKEMVRPETREECAETFKIMGSDKMLQYNGGVFAYHRNPVTQRFIRTWHEEWKRYGRIDQPALDRAMFACPVRILTLGRGWNTIVRYDKAEDTFGILHRPMTARRWSGHIDGRLDSPEAWRRVQA